MLDFTFSSPGTKYVRFVVTDPSGRTATVEHNVVVGAPELPTAPANTSPPVITGATVVGQVLTASTGLWSGAPTSYGYKWQDCTTSGTACASIAHATASSYTLAAADGGHTVSAVVTATNSGGTASANSAVSATVTQAPPASAPANSVLPSISGSAVEGKTLTASTGTWSESPTSFGYQWEDCSSLGESCVAVAGATTSSYTLRAADVGDTMRVVVTATNSRGTTAATSVAGGVVVADVSGMPAPLPAAGTSFCSVTVSSVAAVDSSVEGAAGGTTVCVKGGTYEGFTLSGAHSGDVTVQPVPGEKVMINGRATPDPQGNAVAVFISPRASHIIVHGFYIDGMVELREGTSYIRVDHNDIETTGLEGVYLFSENGAAPHAPVGPELEPVRYVTISGNMIHGVREDDAININNWEHVRVTGNDIYNIVEAGNHEDCLQSTFGGSYITFDHNYEHDNQCQGFFIKDGDVTGVLVYDNLFLRDRAGEAAGCPYGCNENVIQIFDSYGVVLRNNTNWSGNGDVLRAPDGTSYTAEVDHNVAEVFNNGCCSESVFELAEGENIFGREPFTFTMAPTDVVNATPQFVEPAHDDYRLASNPSGIGVDWRPAEQQYGP